MKTLELLKSYGLSNNRVKSRIKDWKEEQLEQFFSDYMNVIREQDLVQLADRGSTDVFPDSVGGRLPLTMIRQLCIYVNRIYIHDPIIDLWERFNSLDTNFELILSSPNREDRLANYRNEFEVVVEQLLDLEPLITLGVVYVVPSQLIQSKREPGALYGADLYGPKGNLNSGTVAPPVMELPPGLADYINSNIRISPASFKNDKMMIYPLEDLDKPRRMIAVRFADEVALKVYFLGSMSINKNEKGEITNEASMVFPLNDNTDELDANTFEHWVIGESQKYVRERLDELNTNLFLAATARAHFLTNIPSSKDLISLDINSDNSNENILKTLLEVELPYLSNVEISELANARKDEMAFQEFRTAFDKAFSELESMEEDQRPKRIDELVRDLIQTPILRIDNRLQALHRNVLIDSVLAVGAFASTILSGGNTLIGLATMAAAAKAADSYKKAKTQEDELREQSSFFYWQATKNARKRK